MSFGNLLASGIGRNRFRNKSHYIILPPPRPFVQSRLFAFIDAIIIRLIIVLLRWSDFRSQNRCYTAASVQFRFSHGQDEKRKQTAAARQSKRSGTTDQWPRRRQTHSSGKSLNTRVASSKPKSNYCDSKILLLRSPGVRMKLSRSSWESRTK